MRPSGLAPVILSFAILASVAPAAMGQDQPSTIIDPVQILHPFVPVRGWQACDRWLSARAHRSAQTGRLEDWALGYATAYMAQLSNAQKNRTKLSNADLFKAIDGSCRSHADGIGPAIRQTLDQAAAG